MRSVIKLAAAAALFGAAAVDAASSGDVGLCDALSDRFGCHSGYINNDRKRCRDSNQIMDWVVAPTRTDKYRFRSGDGAEASDPNGYNPGTVISLFLTVTDYEWKYRGLLVQGHNSMNETVGEFEYSSSGNQIFWTPTQCAGRLLHVNAEPKPFKVELKWRAPPAGTGPVTFRTLVKRGPANVGEFHYANLAGDLTLRELLPYQSRDGTVDRYAPVWVLGEVGESCDSACARLSSGVTESPTMSPTLTSLAPTISPSGLTRSPSMSPSKAPTITPGPRTHNISWGFNLAQASKLIKVGDTVTWVWDQMPRVPHDVVSGGRSSMNEGDDFRSDLLTTGTFSHTFNESGTFPYFCTPHMAMFGVITVLEPEEIITESPTPTPTVAPTTTYACDGTAISAVSLNRSVTTGFADTAGLVHPCPTPLVATCSRVAPARNNDTGNCMLRAPDCLEDLNETCDGRPHAAECGMSAEGYQRFCPCRPAHPWPDVSEQDASRNRGRRDLFGAPNSAAGRMVHGGFDLVTLSTLMSVLHATGRTSLLTGAVAVGLSSLAVPAAAHNWQFSPARARREASTTAPCRARKDTDTHAQVGPGQTVTVQWATGHSRPSYWVVVHEDDYGWLSHKEFKSMVREYIDEAPQGADTAREPQWQRLHGVSNNQLSSFEEHKSTNNEVAGGARNGLDTYGDRVLPTDPLWINHTHSQPANLFKFKSGPLAEDRRISYLSEKYPWLEAAYRYDHVTHRPVDFDTVRVSIPGRKGAGHYIVHWWWNGYYDCTDVDVFDDPVPEDKIYGTDLGTYSWEKIDHCQYVEPRQIVSPCRDASESAVDCRAEVDGLRSTNNAFRALGVNVVPLVNPSAVAFPDVINVPWSNKTCTNSGWLELAGTDTTSQPSSAYAGTPQTQSCRQSYITFRRNARISFHGTMADAVKMCTPDNCIGIAWNATTASPSTVYMGEHDFWLCRAWDAESETSDRAFIKPNLNRAQTLRPMTLNNNARRDIIVDFHPNSTEVPLESNEILRDHGYEFSQKGQYRYGWSCRLPQNRGSGIVKRGARNDPATTINTAVHRFELTTCRNDNNRSAYWEIELPNGLYNITTTHNRLVEANMRAHPCAAENTQMTSRRFFSSQSAELTQTVEITDGRFTLTSQRFAFFGCELLNRIRIVRLPNALLNPVWFPSSNNGGAFWQRQFARPEPVGLVSVSVVTPDDCSYWWLFHSNKCNPGRPLGPFWGTSQGYTVTVADSPCNSAGCAGGTVCSRFYTVPTDSSGVRQSTMNLDCGGAVGRYIRIHLPGEDRVLPRLQVGVHRSTPANVTTTSMACYGVEAREKEETSPEYIITDDPADPIFYSTCYERMRQFEFLPVPDKEPAEVPRWAFGDKCLTCDNFIENLMPEYRNTSTMLTTRWSVSPDQCFDCDISDTVPLSYVCSAASQEETSNAVAIAIGVTVTLVIIIVAIAVIVLYRRRNSSISSYKRHSARSPATTSNPTYECETTNPSVPMPSSRPPSRPVPTSSAPTRPVPALSKPPVIAKPKRAPPSVPSKPVQQWEAVVDESSGEVYFVSGDKTQWECPYGRQWSADVDPSSGKVYYTNSDTDTTQWEVPMSTTSMGGSEI